MILFGTQPLGCGPGIQRLPFHADDFAAHSEHLYQYVGYGPVDVALKDVLGTYHPCLHLYLPSAALAPNQP